MKKDLIVASILLAGSIVLYASLSLMEDPAAASFPRVVIVIMGCLGLTLVIQTLIARQRHERAVLQSDHVSDSRSEPKKSGSTKQFSFGTLAICFVLIVLYFVVMEKLGFYVSAFLFFIVLTFILGRKNLTLQKGAVQVGIAFIFTAVLFLLFNKLLVVQTPKGLLF
ncbi:MAG: tripartite tricarboxylate transporter TctB family protein [Desulfobacterales bacterium]